MVAAEPGQVVATDQLLDRLRHRGAHRREAGVGQREVADVGEQRRGRDIEVRVDAVAQHVAGLADRARTEARPWPVAYRAVPGQAGDGVAPARVGDRHLQEGMVREEGKGAHHAEGGGTAFRPGRGLKSGRQGGRRRAVPLRRTAEQS